MPNVQQIRSRFRPRELRAGLIHLRAVVRRLLMYPGAWLYRRLNRQISVIAITGSAGKTTSKDFCAAMLSRFGPCVNSIHSENYRISAAETVLRMRPLHRYCVLELSGGKPDALDLPIRIAKPRIGVLTMIGRDHYSAFKSLEAIAEEKRKLIDRLPGNGVAVLNIDDPLVRTVGEQCRARRVWVGRAEGATLRLLDVHSRWPEPLVLTIEYEQAVYQVPTRLHGEHLALSVLAALGVAVALELPLQQAIEALHAVEPTEGRMEIVTEDSGVVFVRDDWKAPHWSIGAPFKFVANASATRKIVVVGTVSDSSLGPSQRYARIAREIRKFADIAIFIGQDASRALKARTGPEDDSIQAFVNIQQASGFLDGLLQAGDLVLLKGTNPQDHLVRLILARRAPIACWESACGLHIFCNRCERLYTGKPGAGYAGGGTGPDNVEQQWQPSADGPLVVVGLGNPGEQYADTPHNLGYAVVDRLAATHNGDWVPAAKGSACRLQCDGAELILYKPDVAINFSGDALRAFVVEQPRGIGACIIVHDDMDLTLGQVKLIQTSGHTGHNGVRSVIRALGSDQFERMRVGGRQTGDDSPTVNLVLETFSAAEEPIVSRVLDHATDTLFTRCRQILAARGGASSIPARDLA